MVVLQDCSVYAFFLWFLKKMTRKQALLKVFPLKLNETQN